MDKSTVEISQNFLAFSEYMNFNLSQDKVTSKKAFQPIVHSGEKNLYCERGYILFFKSYSVLKG